LNLSMRLSARIEIKSETSGVNATGLLMAVASDSLMVRSPLQFNTGELLTFFGEINMRESLSFPVEVEKAKHHVSALDSLDYFELKCRVLDEVQFRKFIHGLSRTSREMKEDLRINVEAPVKARLDGKKFDAVCRNISRGGLFLAITGKAPEIVTLDTIDMRIDFPPPIGQIECSGEVVYVMDDDEAERLDIVAGAGIRLDCEDEERRFKWEDILQAFHKALLGHDSKI